MARIALIGPGAIGATIAAWLLQDPRHDVVIAARSAFSLLEVETPFGVLSAEPRVLLDPKHASAVDWVLIATKAYDVEAAAAWLRGFRRADTPVAVLQNGVEHVARFEPYVPRERIVPVMVECSAERLEPGRVRQRSPGRLVVPDTELGRSFVELFARSRLDVSARSDFETELWKKLCLNSAGALSAVLLAPSGIAQSESMAEILREIVRECILVGRASGAELDDDIVQSVLTRLKRAPPDTKNSLLSDRLAGRPMEIDARNGVIVRLGREHGIPTPMNALMVTLLEAARR